MQYTENYSMNKPQFGENALVTRLNENADTLDTLIYNTRQMQADTYDSTQTYNTGDLVSYNSALYICLADNVTGAWDSTKWSATTLAEQVELAKQSGGESALADLEDVEITNPSTGQALLFDDSDDKWKNQNLPDVSVTKEASGNPIELTDAADAPLVKCVTEIQGSQDLHGYDKPWVGGAGKNKYSVLVGDDSWGNNASGTHNTGANGSLVVNCTDITSENSGVYSDITSVIKTNILNLGTCYVSFDIVATSSCTIKVRLGDGQNRFIDIGTTKSRINVQITPTDGVFVFYGNYNVVTLTISNVMLSTVSGTDYEPYSNICPITAYNQSTISIGVKNWLETTLENLQELNTDGTWSGKVYSINGITITVQTNYLHHVIGINANGTVTSGNFRFRISDDVRLPINEKYIFSGTPQGLEGIASLVFRSGTSQEIYDNGVETEITPTNSSQTCSILFVTNKTINNKTFIPSIRNYGTSATIDHTATFSNSIYQGNADFVGGSAECDMLVIDLGDLTWTYDANYARFQSSGIADMKKADTRTMRLYSSCYEDLWHGEPFDVNWDSVIYNGVNNNVANICVHDHRYTDATAFKTAVTGQKIAYELATPTTETITPTNLPIKSLSGYNHIESTTGEMEVEYITEEYQPLVDLIQSGNGHTYSTSEQVVGKWIDGKDLYERTVTIPNVSITTGASQMYYSIIDLSSYLTGLDKAFPDIDKSYIIMQDTTVRRLVWIDYQSTDDVIVYSLSSRSSVTLVLTLQYTKSTTTRSLSAPLNTQKAPIEPLTDKTEEVPTEEEKAVNEEENTNENR